MSAFARTQLIHTIVSLRYTPARPARLHAMSQIARTRQIVTAAGANVHDTLRDNFLAAAASIKFHYERMDTRRPPPTPERLAALQARLGYTFQERSLLDLALTHRSAAAPNSDNLAWVGDAALELVLTEQLAAAAGATATASQLTDRRSRLASREHCAKCARSLDLEDLIVVGKGILQDPTLGRLSTGVLGETFEALLGAVMVDSGGLDAVRQVYIDNFPLEVEEQGNRDDEAAAAGDNSAQPLP